MIYFKFGTPSRIHYISDDGGISWTITNNTGGILASPVDVGMIYYTTSAKNKVVLSAPLGDPPGAGDSRQNIGLWISDDERISFVRSEALSTGHAGYLAIEQLDDGSIGLLYEAEGSTRIVFLNLELEN